MHESIILNAFVLLIIILEENGAITFSDIINYPVSYSINVMAATAEFSIYNGISFTKVHVDFNSFLFSWHGRQVLSLSSCWIFFFFLVQLIYVLNFLPI